MGEDTLLSPGRQRAAAIPPAAPPTPAAASAAGQVAAQRPAGCHPPRLEISPLTIRPAADLAHDRELERRPVS